MPSGTVREYFADTYQFSGEASVAAVSTEAGKDGAEVTVVVLDRTWLHPQGGGQPSDTGRIRAVGAGPEAAGPVFVVERVVYDRETKLIHHHGHFAAATATDGADETDNMGTAAAAAAAQFEAGASVVVEVDEANRRLHARLHSAGHLLDAAMKNVGRGDLEPGKGYHFRDGAYVEYIGKVDAEDRDALIEELNREIRRLIELDTPVEVQVEEANGDVRRTVSVGGTPCPCGGTHIKHLAELGQVIVTRIKKNKKNVKVSYSVS